MKAAMDITKIIAKIESNKTTLPPEHKDAVWMDGFNHGLDWAVRILERDKSAS